MQTPSCYSRQNCTPRAPLHCAKPSPPHLKRPFKYFSFAKQAVPPKEAEGNWNDLGLIFLGEGILSGHSSTFSPCELFLEQTVKHIFQIFVFSCLSSSRCTMGGISPGGSPLFLISKKWWLIYTVIHARWQPWRKLSIEWPFGDRKGAFYFSRKSLHGQVYCSLLWPQIRGTLYVSPGLMLGT
jgi:hypothetical protein